MAIFFLPLLNEAATHGVVNGDTSHTVHIQQVEQGMRTLTHEWRNVLNGINLRISSAQVADSPENLQSDLSEAQQLIQTASGQMMALSRRLATPSVTPIPYPTEYFLEDIAVVLARETGPNAAKLKWENTNLAGKVMVDFIAISQVVSELIDNTLRYHSGDKAVVISSHEEKECLVLSWSEKIFGAPSLKDWGRVPFFTTERGHLGLGLYFAQRVVTAHQGTLQFDFAESTQTLRTSLRLPLEIV